jgi:hypothetical protein
MWYRPIDFFTPDPVKLQLFLFLFLFSKKEKPDSIFIVIYLLFIHLFTLLYLFPCSAGLSVYINAAEEEPQQRDRTKVIIGL